MAWSAPASQEPGHNIRKDTRNDPGPGLRSHVYSSNKGTPRGTGDPPKGKHDVLRRQAPVNEGCVLDGKRQPARFLRKHETQNAPFRLAPASVACNPRVALSSFSCLNDNFCPREPILLSCERRRVAARRPEQTQHPGSITVFEQGVSRSSKVIDLRA